MDAKKQKAILAAAVGLGAGLTLVGAAYCRRSRFDFADRVVLITGGSRGLGLVMARELARQGAKLVLLARDEGELKRAAQDLERRGAPVLAIRCDVSDQEQVQHAVRQAHEQFGRLDVLINNAGIIQVGPMEHLNLEDFEQSVGVHLRAPLYTTLAVRPIMQRQGGGRIVNISSIGGKVAVPHLLNYVASKHALVGLSNALAIELRQDNILVTTVCPGLMRTGSPRNVLIKGQYEKEYTWFALGDAMPGLSLNAETAARRILSACRRGRPLLIVGMPAKLGHLASELMPNVFLRSMSLVNRILPGPNPSGSDEARPGHECESPLTRSPLTALSQRAARRNNEVNGHHGS